MSDSGPLGPLVIVSNSIIKKQTDRVSRHKSELKFKLKKTAMNAMHTCIFLLVPATSNSVTSLSADLIPNQQT